MVCLRSVLLRSHLSICLIDFNFPPDDPAYSLLVGDDLLPPQSDRLAASRVVHVTIDPDVPVTTNKMIAEDESGVEGEGETDPDRIIVNARVAKDDDGLLTDKELKEICSRAGQLFSAYDRGLQMAENLDPELLFGNRVSISEDRKGASEPVWTSYTHVSLHHWLLIGQVS